MGKLYTKFEEHISHCDNGDILEIGMDRGEGSTKYLIDLAKKRKISYVGVDIESKSFSGDNVHCYHMTGEQYLAQNNRQFSIVYLDNYDWNYWKDLNTGPMPQQKTKYKQILNETISNVYSQRSHLLQAIALTDYLTPNATIMCDDTWWVKDYHCYMGKCSSAIPYLISLGFEVAHTEGVANSPASCVILTRNSK